VSLPRRDPSITIEDLREAGARFLEAGEAYWEMMQKTGIGGAVAWCSSTEGGLAIFTRGEYRETLLRNIEQIGPTHSFGAARE
jgi:hypothetical protein